MLLTFTYYKFQQLTKLCILFFVSQMKFLTILGLIAATVSSRVLTFTNVGVNNQKGNENWRDQSQGQPENRSDHLQTQRSTDPRVDHGPSQGQVYPVSVASNSFGSQVDGQRQVNQRNGDRFDQSQPQGPRQVDLRTDRAQDQGQRSSDSRPYFGQNQGQVYSPPIVNINSQAEGQRQLDGRGDNRPGQAQSARFDDNRNDHTQSQVSLGRNDHQDDRSGRNSNGYYQGPQIVTPVAVPVVPAIRAYTYSPPVVQSPPSSYQFDGQYSLSLPECDLEINSNNFIFKDCDTHQVPYVFRNSQFSFGRPQSTNNQCDYDRASAYVGLLGRVAKHVRRANNVDFYDSQNQLLFSAGLQRPPTQIVGRENLYDGSYTAQLPSPNVQVNGNQIWIQGCENDPISFEHQNSNDISFNSYFANLDNQRTSSSSCSPYQQELVRGAFSNSQKIRARDDNGYDFQDGRGHTVASCQPSRW